MSADLLERETLTDAAHLNALVNHPSVRPTCGGDGKSQLDLTPVLANKKNHVFAWDHGAFLFVWTAPQTYEVHAMILPEGRGRLYALLDRPVRLFQDAPDAHGEHVLEPGVYEFRIAREFDPFAEQARRVAD